MPAKKSHCLSRHCAAATWFLARAAVPITSCAVSSAALGKISVTGEGNILDISGTKLVNNTFASPGVQGCGKVISTESGPPWGANAAMNSALGLPSPSGSNTTELIGNLAQAGSHAVEERVHFGQ
jgi:hypothetical protein